jgi:hypothetical protein
MISTFTSIDTHDPLVKYLMLPDSERATTPKPMAKLREKAMKEGAQKGETYTFDAQPVPPVLNEKACELLCEFLDFMWDRTASDGRSRVDMRMVVPDDELLQLLEESCANEGAGSEAVLRRLKELFTNINTHSLDSHDCKIALRMTRGPTKACINFHTDGGYATNTVQVALNDSAEYKGGRLCFFLYNNESKDDELEILERPAGSVCKHPRCVLHAVTNLTEGTRKSLFVVDVENGLGENGVVVANARQMSSFLKDRRIRQLEGVVREMLKADQELKKVNMRKAEDCAEEIELRAHKAKRQPPNELSYVHEAVQSMSREGVRKVAAEALDHEAEPMAADPLSLVFRARLRCNVPSVGEAGLQVAVIQLRPHGGGTLPDELGGFFRKLKPVKAHGRHMQWQWCCDKSGD